MSLFLYREIRITDVVMDSCCRSYLSDTAAQATVYSFLHIISTGHLLKLLTCSTGIVFTLYALRDMPESRDPSIPSN